MKHSKDTGGGLSREPDFSEGVNQGFICFNVLDLTDTISICYGYYLSPYNKGIARRNREAEKIAQKQDSLFPQVQK